MAILTRSHATTHTHTHTHMRAREVGGGVCVGGGGGEGTGREREGGRGGEMNIFITVRTNRKRRKNSMTNPAMRLSRIGSVLLCTSKDTAIIVSTRKGQRKCQWAMNPIC